MGILGKLRCPCHHLLRDIAFMPFQWSLLGSLVWLHVYPPPRPERSCRTPARALAARTARIAAGVRAGRPARSVRSLTAGCLACGEVTTTPGDSATGPCGLKTTIT